MRVGLNMNIEYPKQQFGKANELMADISTKGKQAAGLYHLQASSIVPNPATMVTSIHKE